MRDRDIAELFERSQREMRPELLSRLLALADEEPESATRASWRAGDVVEFGLDGQPIPPGVAHDGHRQRSWWRGGTWLAIAAAIVAVVALSVLPAGDQPDLLREAAGPTVEELPPPPACAAQAETIGVATTAGGGIRVGLMPDGMTFCVTDEASGGPLAHASLLRDDGPDPATLEEPTIVASGPLTDRAHYFLIAIPRSLPVTDVDSPGHHVEHFPSRVGRRMLVVDVDPTAEPVHEDHELVLRSRTGAIVGTVVASVTSRSVTSREEP